VLIELDRPGVDHRQFQVGERVHPVCCDRMCPRCALPGLWPAASHRLTQEP
jgi:hypothetical protein